MNAWLLDNMIWRRTLARVSARVRARGRKAISAFLRVHPNKSRRVYNLHALLELAFTINRVKVTTPIPIRQVIRTKECTADPSPLPTRLSG